MTDVPFLETDNLRKRYNGTPALDGVSLCIERGEVFGLLGPNGAGKTTTLRIIAGLLAADSGTLKRDGRPLDTTTPAYRRSLGFVPQNIAAYPELTALENLRFFGRLYGLKRSALEKRTAELLDLTGLTPRQHGRVDTFSGGMKRRLNFGIGLLHGPDLLILDEPTVGVDPQSRAHLIAQTRALRDRGVSVIYASHYMEEVQSVCDRVAIMDQGRVIVCDTLRDLLQRLDAETVIEIPATTAGSLDTIKPVVDRVEHRGDRIVLAVRQSDDVGAGGIGPAVSRLLALLNERGVPVLSINTRRPDLEQLFLRMTGKELRD
ncbi:MAG: ABC transporter ATP-binding protein [Phycisphaerales bacterium]|nr:ABC transporter ATP-binding protein [Phycisphaerales bacterium]